MAQRKSLPIASKLQRTDRGLRRDIGQANLAEDATRELLQKTQAYAKDADLKAFAGKMLPVVERHLAHAEQMAAK